MDRSLDPVLLKIREMVEPELERLGFRLSAEHLHYEAFGSAEFTYHRRGTRLRLNWDGKDRWAWVNLAPQPTDAFPHPNTYRDIDAPFVERNTTAPVLINTEQSVARAHELLARLASALAEMGTGALNSSDDR